MATTTSSTLTETQTKAFEAIRSFVNDLWPLFGQPDKPYPFTLYHRLLQRITVDQTESVQKVLNGFTTFLTKYDALLSTDDLDAIPPGTVIQYGDSERVAIEIQRFIHRTSDSTVATAIRSHLLTISALLNPNRDNLQRLETFNGADRENPPAFQIDTTTTEGKFIAGVMDKAKNSLEGTDMSNPMSAFTKLAGSGILNDMMSSFAKGESNGKKLNARKMMRVMQQAMNAMMPPEDDDDDDDEDDAEERADAEERDARAPPKSSNKQR